MDLELLISGMRQAKIRKKGQYNLLLIRFELFY